MKTKAPPLIVLMFLLVLPSYATHYMGGEISWECLSNGNFRFVMKVYRECYTNTGGMAATYSNPETITGPFGNISMYLYPNATLGKKDISPVCHSDGLPHFACELGSSSGMAANLGAVQEWTYTSDSAYPNGVNLNGVPPPLGWTFYWDGCCRNSAANYTGQPNWYIMVKMYPYNGQNAYPCFDNSPRFHSPPLTSIPVGYPFAFNLNVQDPDQDSLVYTLTPALIGVSSTVPYISVYSGNNPLPGPTLNPQNVPAALDQVTGEFSFTSFIQGAYITAVKTSSYRCGVLIAEVTREIQVALLPSAIVDFPQTNTVQNFPPEISFQAQGSGPSVTLDTVWAGEYLEYDISVVDTLPPLFLAPLGTPNGMTFQAAGQDFGDGFSSDSSGCPYPPCATLSPTPDTINSNPNFLVLNAEFRWQTDCQHITGPSGSKDYVHVFSFTAADVACPVPARNTHTYAVLVKDPVLDPPLLHSLDLGPAGLVKLEWSPPDTTQMPNHFNGYFIYHALFPGGPF
ncbi:MAG: hypothetical protein IH599_02395, partial [Bacteroidales bacterium]|nr:hypothetical protein [Bacteroidales bacterium]